MSRPPVPKAELHIHIEGTLEPELAFRLAERNGLVLPFATPADLAAAYAFDSLADFLGLYFATTAVLRSAGDFAELMTEYLQRAAAQGVRYAEIFFDPQAHIARGVSFDTVVDGLAGALAQHGPGLGVSGRLIACFLRDRDPGEALSLLPAIAARRDSIVGVGLDSAENGYPPALFAEVFAEAARLGLHRVAHAGEEGPATNVRDALELLGAERIDHGVRCLEEPSVVALLRERRTPLTVCPLSNLRLKVTPEWSQHPLPTLLEAGLVVTLSSDDPAYFGGYAGDVFDAVQQNLGLSDEQLAELAAASFRAAFLDQSQREPLLAEVETWRRQVRLP